MKSVKAEINIKKEIIKAINNLNLNSKDIITILT